MNPTIDQLLREANTARLDHLDGLADYFVSQCLKWGERPVIAAKSPRPSPQQRRQAQKDSHNPFRNEAE